MKKTFILIILSLVLFTFGCTRDVKPEINLSMDFRYLNEKYVDGNKNYIILSTTGEDLTLLVEDNALFNSLVNEEFYMVAYDENMILHSIDTNPFLKDIYLNSMKQGIDENKVVTEISPVEKVSLENLSLLSEYSIDFDNDGINEIIGLYTAAGKDENGEIIWDDGQIWVLALQDSNKDYILFNGYVQLGNINFYVYTTDDEFYISTLQTGTANLSLRTYRYDSSNDIFLETTDFSTEGNVNMIFGY